MSDVVEMVCPICGKNLGFGSETDMTHIGWVCSHRGFDVKIYIEKNSRLV